MERILINGVPVEVPAEVVSVEGRGRDAIQVWHRAQLDERKIPYATFAGDPVELPPSIAGKSTSEIGAWIADEAERRADPVAYAAKKAAAKRAAAASALQAASPNATTNSDPSAVPAQAVVAASTEAPSKE